jgi:hypothetical protein
MKRIILACSVILLTTLLSGQEIKISISPTTNVFHNKYVSDKPYGSPGLGISTDLDYLLNSNGPLEFGFGLGYQSIRVLKVIPINSTDYYSAAEKINLFSVRLNSIYKLTNEFYLCLAPSIDIQTNHNPVLATENQTGLGLSFGFGGNFRLSNSLLFNVEPRLWIHNVIPFHNVESPFRLSVAGINLGLVYGRKIN